MKRIITIGFIIILCTGLTGCNWFNTEPAPEGGGGVSADESPLNYPPIPDLE